MLCSGVYMYNGALNRDQFKDDVVLKRYKLISFHCRIDQHVSRFPYMGFKDNRNSIPFERSFVICFFCAICDPLNTEPLRRFPIFRFIFRNISGILSRHSFQIVCCI